METREPTQTIERRLIPTPTEWSTITEIAKAASNSGLKGRNLIGQNAIVILLGLENGVSPAVALSEINVIEGKMSVSAVLQAALIKRHAQGGYEVIEASEDRSIIDAWSGPKEKDKSDIVKRFVLTWEEVQKRGWHLTKNVTKPAYIKNRTNMLHHRNLSTLAKIMFPEIGSGIGYTPDELGADIDDNGRMIQPMDYGAGGKSLKELMDEQALEAAAPAIADGASAAIATKMSEAESYKGLTTQTEPQKSPENAAAVAPPLGASGHEFAKRVEAGQAEAELQESEKQSHREIVKGLAKELQDAGVISDPAVWQSFLRRYDPLASSLAGVSDINIASLRFGLQRVRTIHNARRIHATLDAVIKDRGESLLVASEHQMVLYDKMATSSGPF